MTYYINRSGQQYGPYTETELQNMLAQGQVLGTDNAWGEGMAAWAPVSEILAKSAPVPQAPVQHQPTQYESPAQQPAQPQYQQQPQPQYQPQASYAPVAPPVAGYGAPGVGGGYGQPLASGPVPPGLHWFVVLLLGCIPFFTLIWVFIQAGFVKKIDPRSKATMWLALWLFSSFAVVGVLIYVVLQFNIPADAWRDPDFVKNLATAISLYMQQNLWVLLVCYIVGPLCAVFGLVAFFSMRSSIQQYYNSVEPIGLRLSGVMTFFFNMLYFQYHFRRIARWKQTGQLI